MIGNDWDEVLREEFDKEYYKNMMSYLDREYASKNVYPPRDEIFTALKMTPYSKVKAVILGQDPYHGEGQAHGLSFSVKPGVDAPPSLKNMFKELKSDLGCYIPNNGCLLKWARQGVLMLNASLSVVEATPNSHKNIGWTFFTDKIIEELNRRSQPVVFLLWGADARKKLDIITNPVHYVLETVHPSPLSATRGFMGCRHFSKTNLILERIGIEPIDWQIENI